MLDQWAEKESTILTGLFDFDHLGRGREEYIWNSHYPLECLLIFPCSVVTVNGQVHPAKGLEMRNSEPLG